MVNWDKIVHLQLTKKLREIIHNWWKVWILFLDENGEVKKGSKTIKGICNLLLSDNRTNDICSCLHKDYLRQAKISGDKIEFKCYAGMCGIVVPILDNETLIGYVMVGGIKTPELNKDDSIFSEISRWGLQKGNIINAIDEIPVHTRNDIDHFTTLIRLLVDEIINFQREIQEKEKEISRLNLLLEEQYRYNMIIGKSSPMQEVISSIERLADSNIPVLIEGETGTGKELVARALHYSSPRRRNPFIAKNCSAVNDNLLASELFGHEKGAFTSAYTQSTGLFEIASDGAIFFDEIGDAPLSLQKSLLRILEERRFTRVGGSDFINTKARIISATNKDLRSMVRKGEFREDLYYRLAGGDIRLQPLRKRREDIPVLAHHFLNNSKLQPDRRVEKEALQYMTDYGWPGNVRELKMEMERISAMYPRESTIKKNHLKEEIKEVHHTNTNSVMRMKDLIESIKRETEIKIISEGLKRVNNNKTNLAKDLGISRKQLIKKIQDYGIERDIRI